MILYKLGWTSNRSESPKDIMFIMAANESIAIAKYSQMVNVPMAADYIKIEKIVHRELIIPTIEPIKEFKD